jgi:hypothetical protein
MKNMTGKPTHKDLSNTELVLVGLDIISSDHSKS